MKTIDIRVPAGRQIIFPARCVVCEKLNPNGFIKLSFLSAQSESLTELAVDKAMSFDVDPKYYGGNRLNKVEGIPACKGCAAKLKWYHRLLKFGYFTGWLPGALLIFAGLPIWLCVAVTILGAVSPGVFTLMFPPSFGASFYTGEAAFEFKSPTVAKEFSDLNFGVNMPAESSAETAVVR